MDIYHYDPDTGDFIGIGTADESPMEPGVYLVPAHATRVLPPEYDKTTHICRFVEGAWQVCEIPAAPVEPDPPVKSLDDIKEELCLKIDGEADSARLRIAGDPLRAIEYQLAEQEASAYRTAGYTGTVGGTVQSWADAKGWTAQAAADDILAVAAAWNQALYALRDIRLKSKEMVRAASDESAATTDADTAIAQIQAVLTGMGL